MTVSGGNLTIISNGTYIYSHGIRAMERLNFTVTLDGTPVGTSQLHNITSVLPTAVNTSRSLAAATVSRSGDPVRSTWSASDRLALSAHAWHLLHIPVFINGRVAGTFAEPKLGARLIVTVPVIAAVPATNTTNATVISTTQQVIFGGYWSSSNGSYVVPFKLSALGNSSGMLHLLSNETTNTTMVSQACIAMH